MNGKFVRSILVWQKIFGEQFTKMFRLLYQNEYLNDYDIKKLKKDLLKQNKRAENDKTVLVDTKEEKDNTARTRNLLENTYFNLDSLTVKFFSPQALNMTAITERINNSRDVIEFITQTLVSQNDTALQEEFKRELTKDILNTFDWAKYEKILDTAKINKTETTIRNSSMQSEDDGMGGSEF